MTALTDLPDEVLIAIFRNFLSAKLTDHEYTCSWLVEDDAKSNRAALYSLALVSERLSRIALPLLYEQLFDEEDVKKFVLNDPRLSIIFRHMACVRYLSLRIGKPSEGLGESYLKHLHTCISYCVGVLHLKVYFDDEASKATISLRGLARMSGLASVKSLTLEPTSLDDRYTIIHDVSHFSHLEGLAIEGISGDTPIIRPERPLEHLKDLRVRYAYDPEWLSACMALASPQSLRCLGFFDEEYDYSATSFATAVFGTHKWEALESVVLPAFRSLPAGAVPIDRQLPQLKRLHLRTFYLSVLEQGTSMLPNGIVALEIVFQDMDDLLEALTLVARVNWLAAMYETIILDVGLLDCPWPNELSADDPLYNGPRHSKSQFMSAAQEAILAASSMNMQLEPEDLLERISYLNFALP